MKRKPQHPKKQKRHRKIPQTCFQNYNKIRRNGISIGKFHFYKDPGSGQLFSFQLFSRKHVVLMRVNKKVQLGMFARKVFLRNKQIRFLLVYSRYRDEEAVKEDPKPIPVPEPTKNPFKLFKCEKCSERFETAKILKEHLAGHRDPGSSQNQTVPIRKPAEKRPRKSTENQVPAKRSRAPKVLEKIDLTKVLTTRKKQTFKCPKCSKILSCGKKLWAHQKFACSKKKIRCGKCLVKFSSRSVFMKHLKSQHSVGKFACDRCSKVCQTKAQLEGHMWSHTKKYSMRCRICNQLFEKADFLKHKHDEGPKLQCDHCGAQFHATTDLSSHMLVHKEFLEFQCEICREKFKHLHLLKLHAKSHDKPRENYQKCRICKLSFRNVKLHMAMHKTISEKFKCPKCPKYFSTKQLLGFHLDRHAKPFQCDICGDSLGSKAILERHFFMHAAKTYKCRLCPKKFSSEVYLTNHLERHSNERPYKCDKCPKAYKTNDVLRQHLKTHQEKKHECPKCPKKFTLLHHLNDHILTHDKSRSVQCPECGLSLSSKLTLSRHIRYKHSTERNYPCKICSRSFKIHADLTKHLERHENSQKFECETCHREFTNKTYFQRHLKIHENWKKK